MLKIFNYLSWIRILNWLHKCNAGILKVGLGKGESAIVNKN